MNTTPADGRVARAKINRLERQRRTWSLVTQLELIIVLTGLFWLVLVGQGQAKVAAHNNADAIARGNATNDLILHQSDRIVTCLETPDHCPGYVPIVVTQTVTATVTVPGPAVTVPGAVRTVQAPKVATLPAKPAVASAPAASPPPPGPPCRGRNPKKC